MVGFTHVHVQHASTVLFAQNQIVTILRTQRERSHKYFTTAIVSDNFIITLIFGSRLISGSSKIFSFFLNPSYLFLLLHAYCKSRVYYIMNEFLKMVLNGAH